MNNQGRIREFELIEMLREQASGGVGVRLGIGDDAAILEPSPHPLVTACDTLVEGVHFEFTGISAYELGRKVVAVNVSDFAAMGVKASYGLLSMSFPKSTTQDWFQDFAGGLIFELDRWSVALVGGDTTASPGPVSLTLTLFGYAEIPPLLRSGGRPGDGLYVTGTLGDSALGLLLLQQESTMREAFADLVCRHRIPEPRMAWGHHLAFEKGASACQDISDGLLQDVGHLAKASGCAARIFLENLPLSSSFREAATALSLMSPRLLAATGGEDYELVFSVRPGASTAQEIEGVPATHVGILCEGVPGSVLCMDADGQAVAVERGGWGHF